MILMFHLKMKRLLNRPYSMRVLLQGKQHLCAKRANVMGSQTKFHLC